MAQPSACGHWTHGGPGRPTPTVSWWVQAYSGPIEQPKGDVLILLSAAADDNSGISYSSYWRARYALVVWQEGGFKKL